MSNEQELIEAIESYNIFDSDNNGFKGIIRFKDGSFLLCANPNTFAGGEIDINKFGNLTENEFREKAKSYGSIRLSRESVLIMANAITQSIAIILKSGTHIHLQPDSIDILYIGNQQLQYLKSFHETLGLMDRENKPNIGTHSNIIYMTKYSDKKPH